MKQKKLQKTMDNICSLRVAFYLEKQQPACQRTVECDFYLNANCCFMCYDTVLGPPSMNTRIQ